MAISVCPAATVAVPVEDIWGLLIDTSKLGEWSSAHIIRIVPEGPAVENQRIDAWDTAFGKRWNVTLAVEKINSDRHQIQLNVTLPLGITEHTTITCTPIDAKTTRVQYG